MNTNKTYKKGTTGAHIAKLVKEFTGELLGEFTLECALEEVKANNRKLAEFKESLFKTEEEVRA